MQSIPAWTPFEPIENVIDNERDVLRFLKVPAGSPEAKAAMTYLREYRSWCANLGMKHWRNSRYIVTVAVAAKFDALLEGKVPPMFWARIFPRNGKPIARSHWAEMQRIKNELFSPEAEAVELYPAESRLQNGLNTYHLWVLAYGERFPFGLMEGRASEPGEKPSRFVPLHCIE